MLEIIGVIAFVISLWALGFSIENGRKIKNLELEMRQRKGDE